MLMGLTKRLLYMDTRRGCWSKRSPTPLEKQKHFFSLYGGPFCYYFSIGRALCYVFLLMRDFFHCMEAFLLLFLYLGSFFATSFSWCGAFFTMWGPFSLIFSPCGGTFLSSYGDFIFLCFFYGLAPSPHDFFEGACYYVTFIPCPPRSLTAAR